MEEIQKLLKVKLATGSIFHGTTLKNLQEIRKGGKLLCSSAMHGKTRAVWGGETPEAAMERPVHARRHTWPHAFKFYQGSKDAG